MDKLLLLREWKEQKQNDERSCKVNEVNQELIVKNLNNKIKKALCWTNSGPDLQNAQGTDLYA